MKTTQKGAVNVAVVVIIIILVILIGVFAFNRDKVSNTSDTQTPTSQTPQNQQPSPGPYKILSQPEALALVKSTWGDCTPAKCSRVVVSVTQEDPTAFVTAIYEGLRDDSVDAEKKEAAAQFVDGAWVLRVPVVTHSCRIGRGHQDFSVVPCI